MKINEEMKEKKISSSKIMMIPFTVAIIMAIIEIAPAIQKYTDGMGVFEFAANRNSGIPYYFALIFVLVSIFPVVYCVFKENGLKISNCIVKKEKLVGDISFGILAGMLSFLFTFLMDNIVMGYPVWRPAFNGTWILAFLSLVLVSGFFKEIYFRGLANHFLKERIGEWPAYLLTNTLFAILDWFNFGMSFVFGMIWIAFYRRRNRIIVPIIAHAIHNLI
jgi:membrane protease YdiL (CAAX protease family)